MQTDGDFLIQANRLGWDDGSTAIVALIANDHIYVANAGDSRCVLSSDRKAVELSKDHKPGDRLDEKQRIEALGGKIIFYGCWYVGGIGPS